MENFLEGGVAELEAVKAAIADKAQKEQVCRETEHSLKARQKELEIQKKRVEEKISAALKKSRAELDKEFDGQIGTAERAIKDAETKKKNAKAAAVSQRMKEENYSLVKANKEMQAVIKYNFSEAKVPFICRNRLYYSLFKPSSKMDYVVCIIALLICVFVVPFLVTRFISTPLFAVLVWILIVVIFAALYFLIGAWTKKGERLTEIDKAHESIREIAKNKKLIKKKNKDIRADKDESQYNLTEYDNQVDMAKQQHGELVASKEEAVKRFEEVESVETREKMESEYAPIIEDMNREIEKVQTELDERTEALRAASAEMEKYAALLGDKNLKAEKIDELIAAISEGRAENIQQALEAPKSK